MTKLALLLLCVAVAAVAAAPLEITSEEQFTGIVNANEKSLLIFYYADWCGHCKSFKSTYDKIAEYFQDPENGFSDKVEIAKLNAPNVEQFARGEGIQSFPTLIFYGRGERKGEMYKGERTDEKVSQWVIGKL